MRHTSSGGVYPRRSGPRHTLDRQEAAHVQLSRPCGIGPGGTGGRYIVREVGTPQQRITVTLAVAGYTGRSRTFAGGKGGRYIVQVRMRLDDRRWRGKQAVCCAARSIDGRRARPGRVRLIWLKTVALFGRAPNSHF